MADQISPEHDPRSVIDLITAATSSDCDDAQDLAIAALHWRGTRDVLDEAISLTRSPVGRIRGVGARILGQLGIPTRSFPAECSAALLSLIHDRDHEVVADAITALAHLDRDASVQHVLPFRTHPSRDVRFALMFALGGVEDKASWRALIELSGDQDEEVRDWATFGLGTLSEIDHPNLREVLRARLYDEDDQTRAEAACGLGLRRDPIAAAELMILLQDDPENLWAREALSVLLGLQGRHDPTPEGITTAQLIEALRNVPASTNADCAGRPAA